MNLDQDTIAALATPVGTSAIAVVRASGPACERLAEKLGGRAPVPRRVVRCDYRDEHGVVVDDVLLTFFAAPHSFTGEHLLEVSCHGSPFIAQRILEDLLARGCRAARAGEFSQRAFLNGQMDLSQAEAVMDLIQARSERALQAANRQLRGALGRRMTGLIERLVDVLARIEAYIDFPEEDLPPEDRSAIAADLGALRQETQRLRATSHYGDVLRDGLKTVILGPPNVGKSSLLNRLVGMERAIVSPEPGTTRDFIEERVIVGPHCLRLIDTAGLHAAPGMVEAMGIKRAHERAQEADLILWIYDGSSSAANGNNDLDQAKAYGRKVLIVCNKGDIASPSQRDGAIERGALVVSALTGEGIDALCAAIVEVAERCRDGADPDEVVINSRHADALRRASDGLTAAAAKLAGGEAIELLASDLRESLEAYGEIAGRVDNERILDRLFASFCIGK